VVLTDRANTKFELTINLKTENALGIIQADPSLMRW
jgi:hypothetical protein